MKLCTRWFLHISVVLSQDQQKFAAAHRHDPAGDIEARRPYPGWVRGVTLRHGCAGNAWSEAAWQRARDIIYPLLDASSTSNPSPGVTEMPKKVAEALVKVKEYEDHVGARIYAACRDAPLHLSVSGDRPPSKSIFKPHKDVSRGQLVILDMSKDLTRRDQPNRGIDIARVDKVDKHPLHNDKSLLTVTYLVPIGLEKGEAGHSVKTPWPAGWWSGRLVPWQIPARQRGRKGKGRKGMSGGFGAWVESGIDADVVWWSCNLTKKDCTIYKKSQSVVEAQWKRLIESVGSDTPLPPIEAGEDTRDDSADDEVPLETLAVNRRRRT